MLTVDESREADDGVGGFRTVGPMLDPLELLRLAGTRVMARMGVVDVEEFCSTKGFFGNDDVADVGGLSGIFLTVFVETALLSDDRELLKLVRELLLSTSRRLLGSDLGRLSVCCDDSGLRSEAVRRGVELALRVPDNGGATRKDRLRSNDCWFLAISVCSWFDGRNWRRFGVSLDAAAAVSDAANLAGFPFCVFASSLHDDVVNDGVSETRLCVSSNPSSFSSCEMILLDDIGPVRKASFGFHSRSGVGDFKLLMASRTSS